ncbi:hypothetical protein [Rivularia sp. UHCC 0363]|nr:hypothetical protein [Rivularia sp. UHCC 0363]MEA5599144.1 hypothetical protein [Rivularia sp. UHCC 0363]
MMSNYDIEALRFLMSKRNLNSVKYPVLMTEAQMEQMEAIRRKINEDS